ncbi:unnamed protein product [Arctogadus glacialis]
MRPPQGLKAMALNGGRERGPTTLSFGAPAPYLSSAPPFTSSLPELQKDPHLAAWRPRDGIRSWGSSAEAWGAGGGPPARGPLGVRVVRRPLPVLRSSLMWRRSRND